MCHNPKLKAKLKIPKLQTFFDSVHADIKIIPQNLSDFPNSTTIFPIILLHILSFNSVF